MQASESILEAMLSLEPVGKQRERRCADRQSIVADTVILLLDGGVPSPPITITMENISRQGVGFTSDLPLVIGQKFYLRLPYTDGRSVWMECEAVRSSAARNAFYTGATFKRSIKLEHGK